MEASLFVAQQLGKNKYFARQLREWTCMLTQKQEIPISMRGKHVKVKSFLDDEDIRHEIINYLRINKFEFYLSDFVNYVSNFIFPKLGINRETKIAYVIFYLFIIILFKIY